MKPPSRKRSVPLRFVSKEPEPKLRARGRACWFGWKPCERHILLVELKRQRSDAELDLVALQAKLPKRSIEQIESFVQFLKTTVGRRVARLVKQLRQEEQSDKVPIELWTEMAQKMAGSQEAAISSAFSQMLVIAATEPCSLLNSDPPRSLSAPQQQTSKLRTIPLRPMARPPVKTSSACSTPRVHLSTQLSSGLTIERPNGKCQNGLLPSSQAGASPSVSSSPCNSQASFPNLAAATLPKNVHVKGGSTSNNSPSPTSPVLTQIPAILNQSGSKQGAATPKPSQPVEQSASPNTRTSTQGQEHFSSTSSKGPVFDAQTNQKTLNQDFSVDFGNIYQFLSSLNKQGNMPPLSPMESAVVLDLLLSLPEQIPLLNYEELQRHLHLAYDHLSEPVKEPPPPISSTQEAQSHLPQAGGDAPESSLQRETSTIQEGVIARGHTGSMTFCSGEIEDTGALPGTIASQGGIGKGQGDKERPGDQNDDKEEYSSQTEHSTVPSVYSSKPEAGFQPDSMAESMQEPTVLRETAVPSTSKSDCQNIPSLPQSIEQDISIFEKVGHCPLNPFMIPMKLLAGSETPQSEG